MSGKEVPEISYVVVIQAQVKMFLKISESRKIFFFKKGQHTCCKRRNNNAIAFTNLN